MKSLKFFIILLVMLAATTCATAAEMVGSPNDGSFKGVLVDSFELPFGLFTTGCLVDRYPYDLKQAPMFFRQEKLPDNISQINVVIVGATDKKIYLDHYLQIHIWIKYKNNKKERLYSGPFYLAQAKLFKPSMPNGFKGEILKKELQYIKDLTAIDKKVKTLGNYWKQQLKGQKDRLGLEIYDVHIMYVVYNINHTRNVKL